MGATARRIMFGILGGHKGLMGHCTTALTVKKLRPAVLVGLVLGALGGASAQDEAWVWNTTMPEQLTPKTSVPAYASGQRVRGQTDEQVTIEGDAQMRRPGLAIQGDVIHHDARTQTLDVQGDVRVQDHGNHYNGERLRLNLETHEGAFTAPRFNLDNGGRGTAQVLNFLGPDHSVAKRVRYSTCPMPASGQWSPDWVLDASEVDFDRSKDVGTAWGSVLRFKGIPVLASPWMSFPLSDQRKSGFLPLGLNLSDTSGLELVLPYYLNLAPNLDATLYPQLLSKRGVNWGGEFRYLYPSLRGQVRADWMPSDRLRPGADRYAFNWQHQQGLRLGEQSWTLRVNANRVSDDNYWRDFPRSISALTARQLPTDVEVKTASRNASFSLGSYQWQTLQQPDALTPAYDRWPHAVFSWRPDLAKDYGLSLRSELTQFRVDRPDAENGWRWLGDVHLARRWTSGAGFVAPSLRLQARHYSTEQAFSRVGSRQGDRLATVVVPTASVDAGLAFERDLADGGLQTLEPRLLLAYTAKVDQQGLPIYDAAAKDFNFSSIFSPYEYSGSDRVADNQSLTWGVTSRWLRPNGAEWLSLSWAQKQRLAPLTVTLDDSGALPTGASDWLLGASWRYDQNWSASAFAQYDLDASRVRRSTGALRYRGGPFRSAQLAYSFQRDSSELLDLTWQWPLNDLWGDRGRLSADGGNLGAPRWYSVGRLNYSLRERGLVDAIVGLEYDAGCWLSRVALERLQNSTTTASHRLFFQLEFNGMGRLGSSPLESLQENVPYYQILRRKPVTPSRYENYE